jgi:glycosyltransferase involved in cell wall biosynthesis
MGPGTGTAAGIKAGNTIVKTLYVCYFGLREPLVQTQVLPYLRELAAAGIEVHLLTFEPRMRQAWTKQDQTQESKQLAGEGINWSALAYHKRPSLPATLFDIVVGASTAVRLVRRHSIDAIHARAHIPMAMALIASRLIRCFVVFDFRGLMAEEYADAGVWAEESLKFKAIKRLEKAGFKRADQIVVLTQAMRDWLRRKGYASSDKIEVIPCCVDFARYSVAECVSEIKPDRFEIIYAGSVIGLYMLDEMAAFFNALQVHEPRAFFRILTMSSADDVSARLRAAGLKPEHIWVGGVTAQEVPRYLRGARLGVSFRKPTFSQIAASPTKIPEYLAAGLPVVSNAGIGDVDGLLKKERVGVVIKDFTSTELVIAAKEALDLAADDGVCARCIKVARSHFDLKTVGGQAYLNVYRRIGESLNALEIP